MEEMKLTFLRRFDNPLSKYLIFKELLARNGFFGLFNKVGKGSGNSLWYKVCKEIVL